MVTILSYPVRRGDANWPGNPEFSFETHTSIAQGDSCNTYCVKLFNHYGTHMDAPNHYNKNGIKIAEMPFDRFIYENPFLIDLEKEKDQKITPEDLMRYENQIASCDLLMIRTGWSEQRKSEREMYCHHGPAVSSKAAKYLINHFGGTLKAIALDFLSLASPADTTDGDEAHRYMLGVYNDNYINIIEDCDFSGLKSIPHKVYAIPLMMEGVDSSPVTMFAES